MKWLKPDGVIRASLQPEQVGRPQRPIAGSRRSAADPEVETNRILGVLALMLAATTVAGCGCGQFGLSWCHGHGGYYGRGPGGWR